MGVGALCIFFRGTASAQLDFWKVLPRPERFTELYFTDHTHLPTTYTPNKPQRLQFTIHNQEHQTTQYHYIVAADSADTEQLLADGRLTLTDNTAQDIDQTIVIPALNDHVQIRVQLEYSNLAFGKDTANKQIQAIHYWLESKASGP